MSGQPLIHPTDAAKFREQYLATLALQIKNDDKNLQANKIYRKTGQTPTMVLDTRTTAEKLADKNRLKIEVRSGLKDIMDGPTADKVVQEISGDELEFLAQRLPEIIAQLKPKYKYGVPFVSFITFLMEYRTAMIQSNDYLAGLQQKSGQQVLMGIRQILNQMINKEMLDRVADEMTRSIFGKIGGEKRAVIEAIGRDIAELRQIIPTREQLQEDMSQGGVLLTAQIQRQLNDALQELPTGNDVADLLAMLNEATKKRDAERQQEVLEQLHQLLAVSPEVMGLIASVRQELRDAREELKVSIDAARELIEQRIIEKDAEATGRLTQTRGQITEGQQAQADRVVAELKRTVAKSGDMTSQELQEFIDKQLGQQTGELLADVTKRRKEEAELMRLSPNVSEADKLTLLALRPPEFKDKKSVAEKRGYVTMALDNDLIRGPRTKGAFLKETTGTDKIGSTSLDQLNRAIAEIEFRIRILSSPYTGQPAEQPEPSLTGKPSPAKTPSKGQPAEEGKGLRGRGIKGKGIQNDIDHTKGVMTSQLKYAPFGRYNINTHKLNDDIITLKRKTGCNVIGLPVQRVSKVLGGVIRTIVGGGHPEYRQLEKLSDEEKIYLAKLAKMSDIQDRLSIPTPNRDDDEKDINEFEVMKGEIMSGNDNVDLVKKFKILIMKLARKDLLPRNQARDLMMDLATMGY